MSTNASFAIDTHAGPNPQDSLPLPPQTTKMEDIMTSTLGNKYDHTGGQTSAAENASVVIISASERRKRFGIECTGPFGDGITFSGGTWVPGGEYVQTLVVKNVSTKMKKLKYRLPCTRFFSLLYPLEINLSPGTTQVREL
ncbi:hypothetical protein TL16_g02047 [Triparma laevis f. inornata]|uniref:Uncharacterized protein n=1 Tax=Triparma laevis f. inornata TaxID=1714386 RepID=A0A9W7DV19_9STRA|nr:hypothetical protein TL16_g02047 [Triparma laevis f. inornata]